MRLLILAATVTLAFVVPVLADDAADLATAKAAIAAAKLSPASDLDMWCGAAFTVVSAKFNSTGDAAHAKTARDEADALFGLASPLLTADGVADKDLAGISTDYTAVAYARRSQRQSRLNIPRSSARPPQRPSSAGASAARISQRAAVPPDWWIALYGATPAVWP